MSESKESQKEVRVRTFCEENPGEQEKVVELFRTGMHSFDHIPLNARMYTLFLNNQLQPGGMMSCIHTSFMKNPEKSNFWVATIDDEIVGCVGAVPSSRYGGSHLELVRLSVSSKHSSYGVASHLIETVENWARDRSFQFIHGVTLAESTQSVQLYLMNHFAVKEKQSEDLSHIMGRVCEEFIWLHFAKNLIE